MDHAMQLREDVYDRLKDYCMQVLHDDKIMEVDVLMERMMDDTDVPMHHPYHHFIMPAALLTLTAMKAGLTDGRLEEMLELAESRAKNVLGGFCGNYGACGAAVGVGIFFSIYTASSPLSEECWQQSNEITSLCLQNISTVAGPRCCKRTAFLSLQEAVPYIAEKLKIQLDFSDHIICRYYERNAQCKKTACPFYEEKPL